MCDETKCRAIAERIFLKDLKECGYFPKYINLETVDGCNSRCIMCPRSKEKGHKISYMSDEMFDKILTEMSQYKDWIEMVIITSNGEPLLDKKLAQRIKRLKEIGIKYVHFSTNAALLTENVIYDLYQSGLDDIRFSIDGYSKETYEAVRVGLDHDVVKRNVLDFLRIREELGWDIEVRIRMVGLDINKSEQKEWMSYWKGKVRETDRVQIMPAEPFGEFHENERRSYIDAMRDVPCISVFSTILIRPDGTVPLCCSDMGNEYIMGDISDSSIADVWRAEGFEKVRKAHMQGERNQIKICKGCITWNNEFKEEV